MENNAPLFWMSKDGMPLEGDFDKRGYRPIVSGILEGNNPIPIGYFVDGVPSAKCPYGWHHYITKMMDYLECNDIRVSVIGNQNPRIILYAKIEEVFIEELIRKCQEFNSSWDNPLFEVVDYYPFNKNAKRQVSALKSYFDASLFCAGIRCPNGKNIAPFNDYERGSIFYNYGSDIIIKSIDESSVCRTVINGNFLTRDIKGKREKTNYCVVCDIGDFTSTVTYDERGVYISTVFSALRRVDGDDFEGKNIRDAFFKTFSIDANGASSLFCCTEHFVIIADGWRVLHYSDNCDSFEVFEVGSGWSILEGITKEELKSRKIYDSNTLDKDDPDIKEICEVLALRKKNIGKV